VAKRLHGQGRRAVVFLNTTALPAAMSVSLNTLGLESSADTQVRDVWRQTRSTVSKAYTTTVPANDVVMVIVEGSEGEPAHYAPSPQPEPRSKPTSFVGVKSEQGIRAVWVDYVNQTSQTHVLGVEVNGRAISKMAFPSTASLKGAGRLTIELPLSASAAGNTVTFRDSNEKGLMLRSITVLAGSL
jgi:hypothetical protein